MAITHTTEVRNTAADAKLDQIDTGTAAANGKIVFMTSAEATVIEADMANPAFPAAVNGVKTANAIAETGNATGSIALYKIVNRDAVENHRGTVTGTGGGGDIELSSVSPNNEPIRINSYVYTEGA